MQLIELETNIAAPIRALLFPLAEHRPSHGQHGPDARARHRGRTRGIIGANQTVTWRGRHFGVMLTHESLIDRYDPPRYFRDVMIRGHFRFFEHEHLFEEVSESQTLMRDQLRFSAPLVLGGALTEGSILRPYFIQFLQQRNATIRSVAEDESEQWRRYLS